MSGARDHGGGLDAAVAEHGGTRQGWLDLSTGINPVPYPLGDISAESWTALPDKGAMERLLAAARNFWAVPDDAAIVAANGASALIARMPEVIGGTPVLIPAPTYNEHAAAFAQAGRQVVTDGPARARVLVHPNNPDGRLWTASDIRGATVIDESFCDVTPEASLITHAAGPDVVVLKSFGKFWGLAGLRLGLMIAAPLAVERMRDLLGPWAVSGPALEVGARALEDQTWAATTRARLSRDAHRLDALMVTRGAQVVGGTTLFRLYDVGDAALWQDRLARGHVWSRIFPYSGSWLRLGLPHPDRWEQLEAALG
jgi:cobalamin biosynthetic protein CobC